MTILETEGIYQAKVKRYKDSFKKKSKRVSIVIFVIACILSILGIILLIAGYAEPKEIDSFGFEWESPDAIIEKMFGVIMLFFGIIAFILSFCGYISSKKDPENYLHLNKELWLDYIRCEDVSQADKEYFKQKLEDVRAAEIARSLDKASAAVILTSLIK